MQKKLSKKLIIILAIVLILFIGIGVVLATGQAEVLLKAIGIEMQAENKTDGPREKLNFNFGWKFSKGVGKNNSGSEVAAENVTVIPTSETPYLADYNVSSWSNVSLPHTYNDVDTFDNYMEGSQNGERSMYTGTAWYKKTFTLPEEYRGKKIYVEFEAARQAAKVYINGVLLEGTSENGFIAFGYDLNSKGNLKFGADGENDITVMVDNSYPYKIKGTTSSVPWNDSHWQPTYGGLYQNSYLYVMDNLHLTLPLYSFLQSEGTYIYTSDETSSSAKINVNAQIENNYGEEKTFTYKVLVKDMNKNTVLTMEAKNLIIAVGEKKTFTLADTLNNPTRWSTDYPYLYTVVCQLEVNGEIIDNNSDEIGIRTYRFTNDYGMYLNENYVKLQGWGQKSISEWAAIGAAQPDWMQAYTIKMMKDAGANFIRWGHTSGGGAQIKTADEYGLIVLQPGVDGEGTGYDTNSYNLRREALRDMIIYFRNSPSIFMWELGNYTMPTEQATELQGIINTYDYGNRGIETVNSNTIYSVDNSGTYDGTVTESNRLIAIRRGDSKTSNLVEIGITTQGRRRINRKARS